MILTCPSCNTRYLLPPSALLPSGREVRCARCSHDWFQAPPADMPHTVELTEPPIADDPAPRRNLPGPLRPRPSRRAGWLALVTVVAILVAAAVLWRNAVVLAWPPSAKLFDMAGLPVAGIGLTLDTPTMARVSEAGVDVLVVSGTIRSNFAASQPVPPVWVRLLDGEDRVLRREQASPEPSMLAGGATASYRVRFAAPPLDAANVAVSFGEDR